ncbi:MAG TPA: right-handed parallel beta-helix repeat-containing protein [Pseudonocardiaceae bacterium]|nr:right-handed parallel beta-helix repeat-containing protein [Pseudonocardiaceae bacterium]
MATRVTGALVLSIALWFGTGIAIDDPAPQRHVDAHDVPLATTAYPVPDGALFVAPNGSDQAEGTLTKPLATLAAAIAKAPSGGTVVLRGGTYRQTVTGNVTRPITIQPYPGERVWFKGTVVVTGWTKTGDTWQHSNWTKTFCHDCYTKGIIDPNYPFAGWPDMVFADDSPLRQVGSAADVVPGTFYVDEAGHNLVLGDNPAGKTIEATAFDRLLQLDPGAAGSVIRGIGVEEYASNQDYGSHGAMVVDNAPGVTLAEDTFAFSASSGVAIFQPNSTVTGSTMIDNGLVGLVANRADGLRLTKNTVSANNQQHFALSGDAIGAGGAKITRTKSPYVADNYFTGNLGTGWWCDLGCTNATVVRNVATGNQVHGLFYEVSSTALIASNVVADNQGDGIKLSSADHVRVYDNTFADNGTALGIFNDPRDPSTDPYSQQLGLSWVTTGTELVNNYYADPDAQDPIIISADYKSGPHAGPFVTTSDGNAYQRPNSDSALLSWVTAPGQIRNYPSLEAFRTGTGNDKHGLAGDLATVPFVDPNQQNYLLNTGALGISAGLPIPADVAAAIGIPASAHPNIGVLAGPR